MMTHYSQKRREAYHAEIGVAVHLGAIMDALNTLFTAHPELEKPASFAQVESKIQDIKNRFPKEG
jgi:hypothetical protein